ncbi:MAG: hypothetical protein ACLGHL_07860 [Actinomycetota bacterium]
MGRHPTDFISLSFGLIFASLGLAFAAGGIDGGEFIRVWALPSLLIAVGVVIAAMAIARHQRIKLEEREEVADGLGSTEEGHP